MIQLKNVGFSYDHEEPVLSGISFEIETGETMVLCGRNGAGKTTLSKLLNGLLVPDSGDVFVDGINTKDADSTSEIHRKTAVVFENPDNQIFSSDMREDIAFGLENLCLEPGEIRKRISSVINLMELKELLNVPVHCLSAGEKLKIILAGILARKPDYIVLDNSELLAGKDEINEVRRLIRNSGGKMNPAVIYTMQSAESVPEGIKVIDLG